MKIKNIVWDTEDNGEILSAEELGLPTEDEILDNDLEGLDDEEIGYVIADCLSDNFGYCVVSFEFER